MKVIDHTKFAMCEYNQKVCENPFELGDVVIHKNTKEIGVVIQIHSEYELRVDMFGNETTNKLRLATVQDLTQWKNDRMRNEVINSLDLFEAYELLPNNVQKVIIKHGVVSTYNQCEELLDELKELGYTFEYYLDAIPYELRKIGTKHFQFKLK